MTVPLIQLWLSAFVINMLLYCQNLKYIAIAEVKHGLAFVIHAGTASLASQGFVIESNTLRNIE